MNPLRREEFSASKGSGADLNNIKIRASKQQGLSGSMISFFKNNETKKDYSY